MNERCLQTVQSRQIWETGPWGSRRDNTGRVCSGGARPLSKSPSKGGRERGQPGARLRAALLAFGRGPLQIPRCPVRIPTVPRLSLSICSPNLSQHNPHLLKKKKNPSGKDLPPLPMQTSFFFSDFLSPSLLPPFLSSILKLNYVGPEGFCVFC